MNNKLFTSILSLIAIFTFTANAQSVHWYHVPTGGQLVSYDTAQLIIPPYDSAILKLGWGISAGSQPFMPVANQHSFMNATAVPDTILVTDVVSYLIQGTYYDRYKAWFIDTLGATVAIDSTFPLAVNVDTIHVIPSIATQTPVSANGGGIIPYTANPGNTTATISVYVVPNSTTFTWATSYFWTSWPINTPVTSSYVLTNCVLNNHPVAYRFIITNDAGSDTSVADYVIAQQVNNPQITNNIDNIVIGSDSVRIWRTILPNGMTTTYKEALYNNAGVFLSYSTPISLSGFNPVQVSAAFHSLNSATNYSLKGFITAGAFQDSTTAHLFTTWSAPVALATMIDTTYTVTDIDEFFGLMITSQVSGYYQLEIANVGDPTFAQPIQVTMLTAFQAGITYPSVTVGQLANSQYFQNATHYLVRVFSYNANNEWGYSPAVNFLFSPPNAVINSFSVSPSTIPHGTNSMLHWNVTNATNITISGIGTVTSLDSVSTGILNQTTTFTLSAIGWSGMTTTQSVTVTVTNASDVRTLDHQNDFSVYPNLIVNDAVIVCQKWQNNLYMMYDISGHLVQTIPATSEETIFSKGSLPAGEYFMSCAGIIRRIVIQ